MWAPRNHAVASKSEDEHEDSFDKAIEDLDRLSSGDLGDWYNHFSTSNTPVERDDYHSSIDRQFRDLDTSIWCSRASETTLKPSYQASCHDKEEDVEKAPKPSPPGPLPPVGFWNKALAETRKKVFLKYSWTLLILCVFVISVLSIYWGVLFRVKDNLHHATIAIVDFDGQLAPYIDDDVKPIIGPYVVNAALAELSQPDHLGFVTHSPAQYNNDPLNVRVAVHDEKIWGAVIINANATSLLHSAVLSGNASYDPLGSCQIIYNQARDIESYNQYITPPLVALAHSITLNFGQEWTHQVLTNKTYSVDTFTHASQALSPAIGFSIYNLRPFDPPCAIPSVSIGLIYLIIIAFFSFGFFIPTHLQFILPNPTSPHPPLHFHQLVLWRYLATLFAYFLLSLSYSLVSLAFQIPFNHTAPKGMAHWPTDHVVDNANYLKHGGTFALYFILNWCGMTSLGLVCECVAMLVGTPWVALWLIFWVITNVSTSFYSLALAPGFYKWGYGMPLYQIVYASRTLLFGTKNKLALNFGVLIAWIVVGTAIWVPMCYFMRWKMVRGKKREAATVAAARAEKEGKEEGIIVKSRSGKSSPPPPSGVAKASKSAMLRSRYNEIKTRPMALRRRKTSTA